MSAEQGFEIAGQGLAGCCLSWHLHWKNVAFRAIDGDWSGASSKVAAGLLNPVTGKNFEPSWRIADFLPESVEFFERVGDELGLKLWYPLPVVRLVTEKEWPKVAAKLDRAEVAPWVEGVDEDEGDWRAAVRLRGGGRLDVKGFCQATRQRQGFGGLAREGGRGAETLVYCEGAAGLRKGRLGEHRCAKGEILTVRIPGCDPSRILIGGGGWLVPVGGGLFKAGSTYEWEQLDGGPTMAGRIRVEGILERLGFENFEVVAHQAGIRPIMRRSMPLIGRTADGSVVFNGLGSKGSLYAPGVARRLAEWLVEGKKIEEDLDVGIWMEGA